MALNPELLSDDWLATDRIRPPGYQHPVQQDCMLSNEMARLAWATSTRVTADRQQPVNA